MNQSRSLTAVLLAAASVLAVLAFAGAASATTLTSPAGTIYTGTIKATSSNLKFHGPFVTIECAHSAFEGKSEKHGAGVTAGGKISGYSYTGCNYTKTVLKTGSLEIHAGGAVTSSGFELLTHTSVGQCIYTTNNTPVGTLTGSTTTNAVLDLNSSSLPRTGGNFLCGSSAMMTGSYTITTPSRLLVD